MASADDKVNQRSKSHRAGEAPGVPFWRVKSLEAMSAVEWESLCDGCARCCLLKLEDIDDGTVHYTNIACRLLDDETCRCANYEERACHVPTCLTLTPEIVRATDWLPPTCAYRLIAEGRGLYWWHPLVSGDSQTVIAAGISVKGRIVGEDVVSQDDYPDHVARWPVADPVEPR